MKIKMHHTDIGDGYLLTTGQPVFVTEAGHVYGPGDIFPRLGCNVGYLHKVDGVEYNDDAIQWVHDYIVSTHTNNCVRHEGGMEGRWLVWTFGASWKTAAQLAEIERKNGKPMILA